MALLTCMGARSLCMSVSSYAWDVVQLRQTRRLTELRVQDEGNEQKQDADDASGNEALLIHSVVRELVNQTYRIGGNGGKSTGVQRSIEERVRPVPSC